MFGNVLHKYTAPTCLVLSKAFQHCNLIIKLHTIIVHKSQNNNYLLYSNLTNNHPIKRLYIYIYICCVRYGISNFNIRLDLPSRPITNSQLKYFAISVLDELNK